MYSFRTKASHRLATIKADYTNVHFWDAVLPNLSILDLCNPLIYKFSAWILEICLFIAIYHIIL